MKTLIGILLLMAVQVQAGTLQKVGGIKNYSPAF